MSGTADGAVPTPVFPDLAGKVAVVTGGSKGIGAATCRMLAKNNAAVVVVARDPIPARKLADELRADGATALAISADATKAADLERMREQVEAELGPADLLVAFAGGFASFTHVWEVSQEDWDSVIESNLTSTFLTLRCFLPGMIERRRGSVLTMASNAARYLDVMLTASYAAAKAGIVMLTRHAAKEVGPYGVRINCIAPATVVTERTGKLLSPERFAAMASLSPLGRIGMPDDVAPGALYLLSESSGWLTGVTLDVAGGRIML